MRIVAWVFFAWAAYKMSRVLLRFGGMLRDRLAARRFEREYVAGLAREYRYFGTIDSPDGKA